MNQQLARKELEAMGPQVLSAARRGPKELIRVTTTLAPRLREIRPYLSEGEQKAADRILRAAGG